MRAAALAWALLVCCPLIATAADAPSGTLGIRLLDDPARYVVETVEPGDTLRRRVEISNGTAEPLEVELYAAAASEGSEGFDFADGRTGNELTGWTSVAPASVQVPPGRSVTADVEVRVPEKVSDGEHYAVVWAELSDGAEGLTLVSRVGVRMYVTVEAGAASTTPVAVAGGLLVLAASGWMVLRRRVNPHSRGVSIGAAPDGAAH